jgi:hypothetical protein
MTITPTIEQYYHGLNEAQCAIVGYLNGLVITGPAQGKTYSIVSGR